MTPEDEARLVAEAARELAAERRWRSFNVDMQPASALQFAALIQLALRHPGVGEEHRVVAERFLAGLRLYFADAPAVLELLRRGDDPAHDRD